MKNLKVEKYLDVSSPRFFPAYAIEKKQISKATLLNPDVKDIELTKAIFNKLNIQGEPDFLNNLIEDCDLNPNSYDLISTISVLEHIPLKEVEKSIQQIRDLLKVGGHLLVSIPVSAIAFEEYIDFNEYGLQNKKEGKYYFGQRFHDQKMIDQYFVKHFGPAKAVKIFGEKESGFFFKNRFEKLNYSSYPHWKESWIFHKNYKEFKAIKEMPGIGVSVYLFQKL